MNFKNAGNYNFVYLNSGAVVLDFSILSPNIKSQ